MDLGKLSFEVAEQGPTALFLGARRLVDYSLDFVTAAVVKASGAGGFMIGHLLGELQLPTILQVRDNAGCPERVAADQSFNAGRGGPAPDHSVYVRLAHPILGELLCLAKDRSEEGSVLLAGHSGHIDVRGEICIEVLVRRHLVALATLLMESYPEPAALLIVIFDLHSASPHRRERRCRS
jgi:hypothetical protein